MWNRVFLSLLFGSVLPGILSISLGVSALRADTLRLKSGRVFRNVKTKIKGTRIYVYRRKGRVLSFPAAQIQSITPGAVHWPKKKKNLPSKKNTKKSTAKINKKEDTRTIITTKNPKESLATNKRKKTDSSDARRQSPSSWMLALQGGVPLWSGLYANPAARPYAYALSGLELVALANFLNWQRRPTPLQDELLPTLVLLAAATPLPPPPVGQLPRRGFNIQALLGNYQLVSFQRQVVAQDGKTYSQRDYDARRLNSGMFLLSVLVADAALSYFYGNPASAEATQTGFDWSFELAPMTALSAPAPAASGSPRSFFWNSKLEFRFRF